MSIIGKIWCIPFPVQVKVSAQILNGAEAPVNWIRRSNYILPIHNLIIEVGNREFSLSELNFLGSSRCDLTNSYKDLVALEPNWT
jgi:hypothetical protein